MIVCHADARLASQHGIVRPVETATPGCASRVRSAADGGAAA